jgi:amino acid transporter
VTDISTEQVALPVSGLRREVGPVALMFVSLGSVIGSGWLLGALTAASVAGGASVLSWLLAGAVMVLLALVHAELGGAYPFAGGTARYPRIAFGALAGFIAGWVGWLAMATLAPLEVEAALSYLEHVWPGLVDIDGALTARGFVIAVVLIAVFTVVNILGVKWLAESNRVVMLWKTAVPVLTVIVLVVVSFHPGNFTAGGGFAPFGAHGVFAALPLGVVFALNGFEQALQLGGESRNPGRDLPRAVIGSVVIGTVIYLGLEIAFIGALNPANLLSGWAAPVGKGDFGPYASLALTSGLGWLAVVLYIDAFLSPAGTGLVYTGTSARLGYALGHYGQVPRSMARISKRGVPWVSLLVTFVVGVICFLPFPSWQGFVGLVTSAAVLMYGFAPVTLIALRRSDPDRARPYRLKGAPVIAPLAFIAASEIIYWTSWSTVEKLLILVATGLVIFGLYQAFAPQPDRRPWDGKAMLWILPWLIGLGVISYLGQYGGIGVIPAWTDLATVAVFALAVFYLGVRLALPPQRVTEQLAIETATEPATS